MVSLIPWDPNPKRITCKKASSETKIQHIDFETFQSIETPIRSWKMMRSSVPNVCPIQLSIIQPSEGTGKNSSEAIDTSRADLPNIRENSRGLQV